MRWLMFATMAVLALAAAKLVGFIDWSWWWVTAPVLGLWAVAGIAMLIVALWHPRKRE